MPEATLRAVARLAGVAPITVSRVVNGAENVAAATREKVLAIIRDLDYTPNVHAAQLSRRRSKNERHSDSSDGLVNVDRRLRERCNSSGHASWPSDGSLILSPAEGRELTQELIRLLRDVEDLRKYTQRIQRRVELMQKIFRRLSSVRYGSRVFLRSS